jgi:tetratricopeptide (TPR) repeat protein
LLLLEDAIEKDNYKLYQEYFPVVSKVCIPSFYQAVKEIAGVSLDRAIEHLNTGAQINDEASLLFLLRLADNDEEIVEYLERLVQLGSYGYLAVLCRFYEKMGEYKKVADRYELALKSGQVEAFLPYIEFLIRRGNYAKAKELCDKKEIQDMHHSIGVLMVAKATNDKATYRKTTLAALGNSDADNVFFLLVKMLNEGGQEAADSIMEVIDFVDKESPNYEYLNVFRLWLTGKYSAAEFAISLMLSAGKNIPGPLLDIVYTRKNAANGVS